MKRFDFLHSDVSRSPLHGSSYRRIITIAAVAGGVTIALFAGLRIHTKPPDAVPQYAAIVALSPSPLHHAQVRRTIARRSNPKPARRLVTIAQPLTARPRRSQHARDAREVAAPIAVQEHVLAVSAGGSPHAIIAVHGQTRIVTVGDVVDGRRIAAIGMGGLRLSGMQQPIPVGH